MMLQVLCADLGRVVIRGVISVYAMLCGTAEHYLDTHSLSKLVVNVVHKPSIVNHHMRIVRPFE